MQSDSLLKHLAVAFALAVCAYALTYGWIEHRRTVKGPWEITFSTNATGEPQMAISQARLGITNRVLIFPGETVPAPLAAGSTLHFDQAREVPFEVPFGQCIFQDATFLPGSLTFRVFGHEIELLPRALIIDHREHNWTDEPTVRINRLSAGGA